MLNKVLGRAQRIEPNLNEENTDAKSGTVHLKTLRYSKMVYRAKKKLKNSARIKLDLTKSRYTLLDNIN